MGLVRVKGEKEGGGREGERGGVERGGMERREEKGRV